MQRWLSKIKWLLLVTPIFLTFLPIKQMNLFLYILGYLLFGLASVIWLRTEE